MKILQHIITLIMGISFLILLSGCGLKGDLYLPESANASSVFAPQESSLMLDKA